MELIQEQAYRLMYKMEDSEMDPNTYDQLIYKKQHSGNFMKKG